MTDLLDPLEKTMLLSNLEQLPALTEPKPFMFNLMLMVIILVTYKLMILLNILLVIPVADFLTLPLPVLE